MNSFIYKFFLIIIFLIVIPVVVYSQDYSSYNYYNNLETDNLNMYFPRSYEYENFNSLVYDIMLYQYYYNTDCYSFTLPKKDIEEDESLISDDNNIIPRDIFSAEGLWCFSFFDDDGNYNIFDTSKNRSLNFSGDRLEIEIEENDGHYSIVEFRFHINSNNVISLPRGTEIRLTNVENDKGEIVLGFENIEFIRYEDYKKHSSYILSGYFDTKFKTLCGEWTEIDSGTWYNWEAYIND